jgi:hypothetical protein
MSFIRQINSLPAPRGELSVPSKMSLEIDCIFNSKSDEKSIGVGSRFYQFNDVAAVKLRKLQNCRKPDETCG